MFGVPDLCKYILLGFFFLLQMFFYFYFQRKKITKNGEIVGKLGGRDKCLYS